MTNLTEPTTDLELARPAGTLERTDRQATRERAAATAANSLAPATRESYRTGWAQWQDYCGQHGLLDLPAAGDQVAEWAQHLADAGMCAGSVGTRLAAVGYYHRQTTDEHGGQVDDPTKHAACRAVLRGLRRGDADAGRTPKQAQPLDETKLGKASVTLRRRRRKGRGYETQANADRRAARDYALLRLLWSAMLRRSEAAALRWCDLDLDDDGTGLLTIRRSKTDQTGRGASVFVGRATCAALAEWRGYCDDADGEASLFGLTGSQVGRVVARACREAGLGDGHTGHSGRVGMAQHLAAEGAGLVEMTQAGRWRSPTMPVRYARAVAAKQGAVARLAANS